MGLKAKLYLFDSRQSAAEVGNDAAGPGGLASRMQNGCELALGGSHGEALEAFLAIVSEDRGFMDDAGRKAMVAVFDILPNDSELTYGYRNKLSSLLFS